MDNIYIPIEILQIILENLDFLTQIRLRQINAISYKRLLIYDFYNIPKYFLDKLDYNILHIYPFITKLDAHSNNKITTIGIKNLNLIKLNISHNDKINDINWMKNLKILYAECNCSITNESIKDLNLVELNIF